MKVLWFSGNPALYANRDSHNGGGWIASLQRELMFHVASDFQLAIAFPWNYNFKQENDSFIYYGIKAIRHSFWRYKTKEEECLCEIKKIIEDFGPDVIHVFGTEQVFGLVATCTNVPVVIHLQGILTACREAWLPYSMSWSEFCFSGVKNYIMKLGIDRNVKRELQIFRACKNYMGRTDWDKRLSLLLNPESKYYYCSEMLRPEIYYSDRIWKFVENKKIKKIISVISGPLYKGGDVILRVAKILKQLNFPFIWNVYGVHEMKTWEKITCLKCKDVNVVLKGVVDAKNLVDSIVDADIFVHPSYIENSPNSVCEAQVLGIPIVACNVGGVSSIIRHEKTGVLVPANDIFMMASRIKEICECKSFAENLGRNARIEALTRHSPQKIIDDLMNVYISITR